MAAARVAVVINLYSHAGANLVSEAWGSCPNTKPKPQTLTLTLNPNPNPNFPLGVGHVQLADAAAPLPQPRLRTPCVLCLRPALRRSGLGLGLGSD